MSETDPLKAATPDLARLLFDEYSRVANGYPHSAVVGAASNVLLNSIRQEHASWRLAEPAWDELFGRLKEVLKAHYESTTGVRRNVFPYTQHIQVPHFVNQQKFTLKPS